MKYSFYCPTGFYFPPMDVHNYLLQNGIEIELTGIPNEGFKEFNVQDKRLGNDLALKQLPCDHLLKRMLELQKLILQFSEAERLATNLVLRGVSPFRKHEGFSVAYGTPRQELVAMNLVRKALAYFISILAKEYSLRCK